MRKYIDYIVIGIKEHMVYPSAIWAKLFSKIIYLYLQFSIWTALFFSHSQINPLINREDTLKYIIVATIIWFCRSFNIHSYPAYSFLYFFGYIACKTYKLNGL